MTVNLRTLNKEKRDFPMKRFLMPTAPAAMKKMAFTILCVALLLLVAAPAWAADPCSPALPVGSATGCGVLITITGVSGDLSATMTGDGTANSNPYDGLEDILVGIQNNSSAAVGAIRLSASSELSFDNLFQFDGEGPCGYPTGGTHDCFNGATFGVDPGDYQGPNNTFTSISGDFKTGTVSFNLPIAPGGSTWFALESTPQIVVSISEGTISQTQTLSPGQTSVYPAGNDNSKWTPSNTSAGGEQLTVTAVPILESSFTPPAPFGNQHCVPYRDFTEANGAHTCVGFQTVCVGSDCSTLPVTVMTNYELPTDLPAIGGPDFLVFHGQPCPPAAGATALSIFTEYGVNRFDPYTKGGSTPVSCYIATYTPGAPLIVGTGTQLVFTGFQSPVSDTDVNLIKAGSVVPLKWQVSDINGAITTLSYCGTINPEGTCGTSGVSTPWVNLSILPIACAADLSPVTVTDSTVATNSGFQNLGGGSYQYNWKTVKGTKGCVTIRATFSSGLVVAPAQLGFKYQ
jgi:hypothetical protein